MKGIAWDLDLVFFRREKWNFYVKTSCMFGHIFWDCSFQVLAIGHFTSGNKHMWWFHSFLFHELQVLAFAGQWPYHKTDMCEQHPKPQLTTMFIFRHHSHESCWFSYPFILRMVGCASYNWLKISLPPWVLQMIFGNSWWTIGQFFLGIHWNGMNLLCTVSWFEIPEKSLLTSFEIRLFGVGSPPVQCGWVNNFNTHAMTVQL